MSDIENKEIRIRGTVQGVGFRPTVWRLAKDCDLVGEVRNDEQGVLIRVSGRSEALNNFLKRLSDEVPPLAKIDCIEVSNSNTQVIERYNTFEITRSTGNKVEVSTQVSPDAASCKECVEEIFEPNNRRYLYPFTNCTHCGPRLSIVSKVPYDRDNTSMASFTLCEQCLEEYNDPSNRRFHAQPTACHQCGPRISTYFIKDEVSTQTDSNSLSDASGSAKRTQIFLKQVLKYLKDGQIVAIKGIGGFHLCCDATNHAAVDRLRRRKRRYAKPFALMAKDITTIEQYCFITQQEKQELQSKAAPIVLLERKANTKKILSDSISPGTNLLGFMLPYSPLHWLVVNAYKNPLIMTSGNLSSEPQIKDNIKAYNELSNIADLILYHDRYIVNRIDDSVLRCMAGEARVIRAARGYAPYSISLPSGFEDSPNIYAYGAELKSTFCMINDGKAINSQHQGDLEDATTLDDFENNLKLYLDIYKHKPTAIAVDLHPDYLSRKLAIQHIEMDYFNSGSEIQSTSICDEHSRSIDLVEVQHHHAHIASCMAENNISRNLSECIANKVLGIALDGLGYGSDKTIWGGEFLYCDYLDFQRVASFSPVAMIGGVQAIKEPWRNTYAHIVNGIGWESFVNDYADSALYKYFSTKPTALMSDMLLSQMNVPLASSCGRLFDAVSASLGICADEALYEGQGAIELEMLADLELIQDEFSQDDYSHLPYPFDIKLTQYASNNNFITVNTRTMWRLLLSDQLSGASKQMISNRFHAGLIEAIIKTIRTLAEIYPFNTVALSGGCFQNKILLECVSARLKRDGFQCLLHGKLPSNDGGIAFGQAMIAAARKIEYEKSM